MTQKLPDKVIEVIIKALENGDLIQKQARLCDLAALDAIPSEILPYLKLHHQKAIALSSATSERILSILSNSQDAKNKQRVISNYQKQNQEKIRKYTSSNYGSYIEPICVVVDEEEYVINSSQDISFSIDVLENLIEHRNSGYKNHTLRLYIARSSNTPISILEKLSYWKNLHIRRAARQTLQEKAANLETSIEELQQMLNHQDVEVRQAVKLHLQGLNVLLYRCLKPERHFPYQNSLHRVLAGMYPEISTEKLDNLLDSKHWLDRLAVACNPKIPREYLTQLIEDENTVIKEIAKEFLL